jgi:hypothetical protein
MDNRTARSSHDSEGFHANLYLSGGSNSQPLHPKRWEADYHFPKLARVLTQKSRWKTARTTVRTVVLGSIPKQLTLDFSPQAGAEVDEQSSALACLEQAVNKGNEQAFINALQKVEWTDRQARDFARAIKLALNIGAPTAAQQIYNKGVARYPNNADLQRYARLFAPASPATKTLPPNPTLKANREWLKLHRSEYRGQWIAVRNGELLATATSLEELIGRVGDTTNVLLTRA